MLSFFVRKSSPLSSPYVVQFCLLYLSDIAPFMTCYITDTNTFPFVRHHELHIMFFFSCTQVITWRTESGEMAVKWMKFNFWKEQPFFLPNPGVVEYKYICTSSGNEMKTVTGSRKSAPILPSGSRNQPYEPRPGQVEAQQVNISTIYVN